MMNRLDNAGWDPCMQIWNIFVWRLRSLKAMFGITEIMAVGFSWTLWQVFAESTVQRLDVVGQKRNQNCRTGAAREGGEYAVGRKFSAFSGHFFGTKHRRGTLLHILKDLCSVFESWKAVPGFTCYVQLLYALGWHKHWKASALVMCTWIEASPHRHDIGIERQVHQAIQLVVNTISNDFRHLRFSCIPHVNLPNIWDSLREKSTSRCQVHCSIYPALSAKIIRYWHFNRLTSFPKLLSSPLSHFSPRAVASPNSSVQAKRYPGLFGRPCDSPNLQLIGHQSQK